jgi:1-acyl-sn-glycerol-3-phosphate acyltransferase
MRMATAIGQFKPLLKIPRRTRARQLATIAARLGVARLGASLIGRRIDPERRRCATRAWAAAMTRTLRIEVVTAGAPVTHAKGVLLIANHVSWLDICAIASLTGSRFVAKSELEDWPVIGRIATAFGTFLHERGNLRDAARVKDRVAAALRQGQTITIFPEGTTGWSSALLPFYPAFAQAAVDADAIVQPVAIGYRDLDGRPSVAAPFLGDQTFIDSLNKIMKETAIKAELNFGAPFAAAGRTRREITAMSHTFIARALGLKEARGRADPIRLRYAADAPVQTRPAEPLIAPVGD